MFCMFASGVNEAYAKLLSRFVNRIGEFEETDSRNGTCVKVVGPVCIAYDNPMERVLFDVVRDANPFFHLYEALWMLAGRNDIDAVAYYNENMRSYSDDGVTQHGAYGYRWRNHWQFDQLQLAVGHLKAFPETRRSVVQMWDPAVDAVLGESGKDVPCNTQIMFSTDDGYPEARYLNMTVINRSNDLIWGLLGANYVHFSFLHEYMAVKTGFRLGTYYHISNNLHYYTEVHDLNMMHAKLDPTTTGLYNQLNKAEIVPLCRSEEIGLFERQLPRFVQLHKNQVVAFNETVFSSWGVEFLDRVAEPMMMAWHNHKERRYERAMEHCQKIASPDWRIACVAWMQRRRSKYEKKNA